MIPNFVAQAANERTLLSWVRTALTLFSFAFILGKLELSFLHLAVQGGLVIALPPVSLRWLSFTLLGSGVALLGVAVWRFWQRQQALQTD